jgi:hypothetical protein
MNGLELDEQKRADDPSVKTNRVWLERMTGAKVLAVLPRGRAMAVDRGQIDPAITAQMLRVRWLELMRTPLAC